VGKGYLIDSNVVIGYLDDKLPKQAKEMMNKVIDDTPNISVITKIEILRFNTRDEPYKILVDFINESAVLSLSDEIVDETISICKLHRIKLPDALIAATAIIYDLCLLTRNIADFKNIDKLDILNPWDNK